MNAERRGLENRESVVEIGWYKSNGRGEEMCRISDESKRGETVRQAAGAYSVRMAELAEHYPWDADDPDRRVVWHLKAMEAALRYIGAV